MPPFVRHEEGGKERGAKKKKKKKKKRDGDLAGFVGLGGKI
jgi:hypothetical protein